MFLGGVLALTAATLIGVLGGVALLRVVPSEVLHKLAAAAFLIVGGLMLWGESLAAARMVSGSAQPEEPR